VKVIAAAAAMTLLVAPHGAAAQEGDKPKKEKKAADPNKPICRVQEETGSRFTKRICHTAAEWALIDRANNDAASDALRRAPPNN
jgi:hypothetical protein